MQIRLRGRGQRGALDEIAARFGHAERVGQLYHSQRLAFDSGEPYFRSADFTVDPVRTFLSDIYLSKKR